MNGKIWVAALALPAVLIPRAAAQDVPLNLFSSLQSKATEHVEVTLDSGLLQLAAGFLSGKDPEDAKVKGILSGLKGIYVRTLTFAKEGDYSLSDIEKLRAQLKGWNEIVSVREAKENTGIFVKSDGQKIQGLVILSAEPTELTLVNIVGSIQPDQLKDLSGKFGIPDIGNVADKAGKKKEE
jgi:Domain of unknown function (DUF4252)